MDTVVENLKLYFLKDTNKSKNYTEEYEYFLSSLIDQPDMSDKRIISHLAFIKELTHEGNFTLASIHFEQNQKASISFICWNLKNAFTNFKPFIYQGSIYVLKSSKKCTFDSFFNDEEKIKFEKSLSGAKYRLGVSNLFFRLNDISFAKDQCDFALNYSLDEVSDDNAYYYKDYALTDLTKILNSRMARFMTASPYYKLLKNYDDANDTNLCEIVSLYIRNNRNVIKTADMLYMHRNTIQNKLKKASQIMGSDLEKYDDSFFFYLNSIF